jgi:hypothetical protein
MEYTGSAILRLTIEAQGVIRSVWHFQVIASSKLFVNKLQFPLRISWSLVDFYMIHEHDSATKQVEMNIKEQTVYSRTQA